MTGANRVHRLTVGGTPLVAKSARGGSRQHLRREAELLEHMRGLPVVELVALRESDDRTDLVTVDAGDRDLSQLQGRSPTELLTALADTADAVAELHAAGWTHGALCSEHVVIAAEGTVRLCSLGSARVRCSNAGDEGPDTLTDLQQLVDLIEHVLRHRGDTWGPRASWVYRSAVRRYHRGLGRTNSVSPEAGCRSVEALAADLRELAVDLSSRMSPPRIGDPTSRPGQGAKAGGRSPLGGTPLRLVGAAVGVGVLGLTWGAVAAAGQSSGRVESSSPSPLASDDRPACAHSPTANPWASAGPDLDRDDCPDDVSVSGNIVTVGSDRFSAGEPGDHVVVAPITCRGPAQVVLLRASSSEVFTFDEWPGSGATTTARYLGTYPGATSLGVDEVDGCVRLRPLDAAGSPVAKEQT